MSYTTSAVRYRTGLEDEKGVTAADF